MGIRKRFKDQVMVSMKLEREMWEEQVEFLAGILTHGNKTELIRLLIQQEMERQLKMGSEPTPARPEPVRAKGFGSLFLK